MTKLEIDMTREQLIDAISALFMFEHDRIYNKKPSRKAYAHLENLSLGLHTSISPKKEEWIKTDYFNDYFPKSGKERYLANV